MTEERKRALDGVDVASMRDDPLTKAEIQTARAIGGAVKAMPRADVLDRTVERSDTMWHVIGPFVTIWRNKPVLIGAACVALIIGGQGMIDRIAMILQRWNP